MGGYGGEIFEEFSVDMWNLLFPAWGSNGEGNVQDCEINPGKVWSWIKCKSKNPGIDTDLIWKVLWSWTFR